MHTQETLSEIQRLLRNIIRTGVVTDVDTTAALCRVQTGELQTDWLNWLTHRAGHTRTWWAPSVGEQVLLLAVGGELDTAFVLPGIYCDAHPAPSTSPDALHLSFPDSAVIEYEPASGTLNASGITSAIVSASQSVTLNCPTVTVNANQSITLNTPEVICTNKLTTATIDIKQGGNLTGSLNHNGGSITSNGIVLHSHKHGGIERGGSTTDAPI